MRSPNDCFSTSKFFGLILEGDSEDGIAGPWPSVKVVRTADCEGSAHEQASRLSSTEHALKLLIGSLASHARAGRIRWEKI